VVGLLLDPGGVVQRGRPGGAGAGQQRRGPLAVFPLVPLLELRELLHVARGGLQVGGRGGQVRRPLLAGRYGTKQVGLGLQVVRDFFLRILDLPFGLRVRGVLVLDLPAHVAGQPVEAEERDHDQSRPQHRGGEFQESLLHKISSWLLALGQWPPASR
jgi:hypothetical protein